MLLENTKTVTEDELQSLINFFKDILTLQQWDIKYEILPDSKLGKSLMRIYPQRDRNIATIRIRKSLMGRPVNIFGPLLLHEMIHLILDPIIEEHSFQLEFEVSEARFIEYDKRIRRCLEKTIEHLTTNVAKMINMPDQVKAQMEEEEIIAKLTQGLPSIDEVLQIPEETDSAVQ